MFTARVVVPLQVSKTKPGDSVVTEVNEVLRQVAPDFQLTEG